MLQTIRRSMRMLNSEFTQGESTLFAGISAALALAKSLLPTLFQNVFCGADPPFGIYPLMGMQCGEKFTCGGMDLWGDKVSTVFTFLEGQTELTQIFAQTVGIVGRVTLFA